MCKYHTGSQNFKQSHICHCFYFIVSETKTVRLNKSTEMLVVPEQDLLKPIVTTEANEDQLTPSHFHGLSQQWTLSNC